MNFAALVSGLGSKQTGRKRQSPRWAESQQGTGGVQEIVGAGVRPVLFSGVGETVFLPAKADNSWERFEKPGWLPELAGRRDNAPTCVLYPAAKISCCCVSHLVLALHSLCASSSFSVNFALLQTFFFLPFVVWLVWQRTEHCASVGRDGPSFKTHVDLDTPAAC